MTQHQTVVVSLAVLPAPPPLPPAAAAASSIINILPSKQSLIQTLIPTSPLPTNKRPYRESCTSRKLLMNIMIRSPGSNSLLLLLVVVVSSSLLLLLLVLLDDDEVPFQA